MRATLLTLLIVGILSSQPMMMMQGKPDPEIMERIETLKMWKLTEALDLSEEQAAKFFLAIKDMNKSQKNIQQRQMELFGELKDAIDSGDTDSTEILGILDEIMSLRTQDCESETNFLAKMRTILTPEQQAKYVIFEVEFRRKMMQLLRDFRKGRKHGKMMDNPWEQP